MRVDPLFKLARALRAFRFATRIKLSIAYRVGFAKQITETFVQVLASREPKVVDEVTVKQRFDRFPLTS